MTRLGFATSGRTVPRRFAVETAGEAGPIERVVFLALRGEDRVDCFWPIPLELPVAVGASRQLRLIADDGYAGPMRQPGASPPLPAALPRRKPSALMHREARPPSSSFQASP